MKPVTVFHYEAFSSVPHKGNPAGVVLEADHLEEGRMQDIAKQVGFNETVFVQASARATLRLRYFTPGHEMNLCGHATVAALYSLKTRGLLGPSASITIETNVGILPIQFLYTADHLLKIRMKQDRPRFVPFAGDVGGLAASIGLTVDDLDPALPIVYGSTGTWTLLVPIKQLAKFQEMVPRNERFPSILLENPRASVHPFCMETHGAQASMHARHFSSPYSGTIEDPVTGTASGVMGAYDLTYIHPKKQSIQLVVEQGQEIGRDGRVEVEAIRQCDETMDIYISGTAVFVKEFMV